MEEGCYKAIFALDIDGTLTHRPDWVDPKVVLTLHKLTSSGFGMALITGRIFSYAKQVLRFFPFPYILAVQNGADIVNMPGCDLIQRRYLDAFLLEEIEKAHEGLSEDILIYAGLEQADLCYYRPSRFSPNMRKYLQKLQMLSDKPWKESEFRFPKEMQFSLIKAFGPQKQMNQFLERLLQSPIRSQIEVSMIKDPIDPNLSLVMITDKAANKGDVVHFLRDHFRCSKVIAAGNDLNDLPMLQQADIAIAVGDAPQELVAAADIIAKPPELLGIVSAIEEALDR